MHDIDEHVIFYENGRGGAVSLDGGITVIVPTGRVLNLASLASWEESAEDEVTLTGIQHLLIKKHRERPALTPLEQMAEDLRRRSAVRKRRENGPEGKPRYTGKLADSAKVVLSEDD